MSSYKKHLFSGILIFLVVVLGLWFVFATPILSIPVDNGNYTTTFNFTCVPSLNHTMNVTLWYNYSGGDVNTTLVTIINTTTNQTLFYNATDTPSISSLPDLRTYNFTCQAVNLTSDEENSSDATSVTIDNTAPTIVLTSYTNGTTKKNTESLTLNISISDATIGLNSSSCLVDINGTNQSFAISSGTCNFTVGNLTGLDDGNRTIKVYVNDTVNNLALNNSFVVQVDTTVPVITFSCSPTSVYATETITCTCTATDGIDANPTISFTASPSTSNTGSYTTTCNVTDSASNSATSTISYVVGGIKSSGSGTTTPSLPKKAQSWTLITPGVPVIMEDFDSELGVKQIRVRVRNEVQNVKITVTKHDTKPAEVAVAKTGNTYQYLHINAENFGGDIEQATVEFRAERTWAAGVGLGKNDIAVSRYNGAASRWDELTTTSTGEDVTYYYYGVEVDGFSYFAIGEEEIGEEETGEEQPSAEEGGISVWVWILIAVIIIVLIFWQMKIKKK